MPTKYSPRIQRPPSPYRSSSSPRPKSQQRVWRSLASTGESDSSNAFAEKSREMWLKSLRRGGDAKNPHSFIGNVSNPAFSGTPDHLRAQLGLPNSSRRHKRSNSLDIGSNTTFSPTAMQQKSKEDLCDEIISLKKLLVTHKNDYEVLKTKTRRLEEENSRNTKFIEELLDKKTSDEKVRMLAEGGSRSSSSVNAGLKQKILKLEKRLSDKDGELSDIKRQIKMTDTVEMKCAMEMYYQEVLRLQDLINSEKLETSRLSTSMTPRNSAKQGDLRKRIVQLVAENNRLTEENRRLRIDMDHALDQSGFKFTDDEDSDGEDIKLSALNKTELVGLVKRTKASELHKMERAKTEHQEKTDKLKAIISNVKEERNRVTEENEKLRQECDRLNADLHNQIKKVKGLRAEVEVLEKGHKTHPDSERPHSGKSVRAERRRSSRPSTPKNLHHSSDSDVPRPKRRSQSGRPGTPNMQNNIDASDSDVPRPRRRRSHSKRPGTPNTRNNAALSIQKYWHAHQNRKTRDQDVIALQSALRGHFARKKMINEAEYES